MLRKKDELILIALLLILAGCATSPPQAPLSFPQPYEEAFQKTKKYIQKCFAGSTLRANLYTDIPEAEIIIDHLPAASMYLIGGVPISSYERAHDIINIHFVGKGKTTDVITKNELSSSVVSNALNGKECPAKK